MICIGVDPGRKGAYAVIIDETPTVYPWDDMAFVRDMNNIAYIRGVSGGLVACVEKVSAMPGQGVTSMFTFGQSFGFILGVLTALGIPYQLVPPRKWKAVYSLGNDKGQSIEVCKRLFPGVNLLPTERCRKESDGMAEALLMAEYARRKL